MSSDREVVAAVPSALALAAAVREHDVDGAHEVLQAASRDDLLAMAVALASMVPESASLQEVLQYCSKETQRVYGLDASLWSDEELREAHAAFTRRERAPWVLRGEREYSRRSQARRRARDRANAQAIEARLAGAGGHLRAVSP